MRSRLFERRFAIVSGKGGVGRSTLSLVLAWAAARYGLRTCLVQMGARDWAARAAGHRQPSYTPVAIDPVLPLYCANLTPAEALREYGQMKLRFRALHNLVFENDVMRRLTRMIPGMNEMLMLGKAWHMEAADRRADGSPTWDLLVIDAPATGHGVSLLRLPQTICDAVPVGPMAEDARAMRGLLEDPLRTALHVVTLPQDLPATEALELSDHARTTLGVPTGYLFVNQVLPKLLTEGQRRTLQRHPGTAPIVRSAVHAAQAYEQWRAAQQMQLQRLHRNSRLPVVELPHLLTPVGPQHLDELAQVAVAGMEAADLRAQAGAEAAAHP
ncbi:MAG: ArsA family ATPase [Deltaproteobacteria bacterium]|nr:ArsA family ATPase [Deltaproteobacteria bacterium]